MAEKKADIVNKNKNKRVNWHERIDNQRETRASTRFLVSNEK